MNDQNQHEPDAPEPSPDAELDGAPRIDEALATPSDLGGRFRRGMGWLSVSSVFIKAASLIAQLWLAKILAPDDFGLYAAAIGIAGFVTAFRDGGVAMYLIRYGAREYARIVAPVFWFAMAINLAGASLLLLGALGLWRFGPLIAKRMTNPEDSTFLDPQMPLMLVIIAVSMPLGTIAAIQKSKLRLDLRFANLSGLALAGSLVRYFGAVTLAILGFGAISFVLPIVAMTIVESIWTQLATRDTRWWGHPRFSEWPRIIRDAKWLLIGTFGQVFYNLGAYFVVAFFLSQAIVGVYFFAFQMTQQIAALMNTNLMSALAPTLVHISDQPERLRAAARRTLHMLMLVSAPLMLGLTVTIDPFETIVLGGKWELAVLPIQVFGALSPVALSWGLTYSILTSQGRFRAWAIATVLEGGAVSLAAGIGALISSNALGATIATGCALVASRLIITVYSMRVLGLGAGGTLASLMPAWLLAVIGAIPVLWFDRALPQDQALLRFLINGFSFIAIYAIATRLLLAGHIREFLTLIPARLRPVARRLALIGE